MKNPCRYAKYVGTKKMKTEKMKNSSTKQSFGWSRGASHFLLFTFFFLLLTAVSTVFAQEARWTAISSDRPEGFRTSLLSSTAGSIKVNVQVPGFYTETVSTPRGEAVAVKMPKAVSTAQAGEPDLPMTGIPCAIAEGARMGIRVLEARYRDFGGMSVAPSKGDFPRSVDPATVPYTYGDCYSTDAFFPVEMAELYEPYTMRDVHGQNIALYPFAYNPVSKTLRVYYDITVEMYRMDGGSSVKGGTTKSTVDDFDGVYRHRFINYGADKGKYTPVGEEGDLLIICPDEYMEAMGEFVAWKKTRGLNTELVALSEIGSSVTSAVLKEFISQQYQENNNLVYVLLVGDVDRIPGHSFSAGMSYSGMGDNLYGQVVGGDIYNDLFIGRFSVGGENDVLTHVRKVITYERDLTTSDTWCQYGLGVSTTEGSSGHYGEDDYQHIDNLRDDLLEYGYTDVYQDYYHVSGYPSSTVATISEHINSGVGVINYCNHGSETAWQSHTPFYSTRHVNNLTNVNMLPFIFSTACLNGKYDHTENCFAEAWMRAINSSTGEPTGAVGTMMSYISQPWQPPMYAQDEFVDILVESYADNKKHTWGGTAINAIMAIFDNYGTRDNAAKGTYQAWILYGDPSLMLRTKTPQAMTVAHPDSVRVTDTVITVTVEDGEGSLATITDADHNILGRAVVTDGEAKIVIKERLTANSELTLCLFGYNKQTYLGTIFVKTLTNRLAWQDGGTIYVNGDGDLRVLDLEGRQVSKVHVDGYLSADRASLGLAKPGVYILCLGDKLQKMVVVK